MPRYEIIGSGVTGTIGNLQKIARALRSTDARNIRSAYMNGWRNQPRTMRFSAPDDAEAALIGDAVDNALNPPGQPRGGLFREYGLHWGGFGK